MGDFSESHPFTRHSESATRTLFGLELGKGKRWKGYQRMECVVNAGHNVLCVNWKQSDGRWNTRPVASRTAHTVIRGMY